MIINVDTIVKDHDIKIREKSSKVSLPLSKEDRELLMNMLQYVEQSQDPELAEEKNLRPAVGIAAIQVGVAKQMCAVFCEDDNSTEENPIFHRYALVNAKIISYSAKKSYLKGGEGCLSVEKLHEGYVVRSARIKVQAYDALKNEEVTLKLSGYPAIVLQHEIDHFSGIMFYDYINKIDPFMEIKDAIVID